MFVRLYPQQLDNYWGLINEAIDKSIPDAADWMKTGLLRDLMLEVAICWLSLGNEESSREQPLANVRGLFITRLSEDYAVGKRTVTIVCAYAPNGATEDLFASGYELVKKYTLSVGCEFFDFYTTNPRIVHWANMFNPSWKADYFQMKVT